MAVGCDLGLGLLRRAVEAGLALTVAEEGKLAVWGPVETVDPQLLLDLKQNKPAVIRTLRHGERLLRALWKAGYGVRIQEGYDGGLFLLPVGNPQLTKEHWEALFADYEAHHDAGLWALLARLPKATDGSPNWRWWNRATSVSISGGFWPDCDMDGNVLLDPGRLVALRRTLFSSIADCRNA